MGLDPDRTAPEDLALVRQSFDEAGRLVGIQPAHEVVNELRRLRRVLDAEYKRAEAKGG